MKRYLKLSLFLILSVLAIYLPTIAIKDLVSKSSLDVEADAFAKHPQSDAVIIESSPLLIDKNGQVRSDEKFLELLKQDKADEVIAFNESSATGLVAASAGGEFFASRLNDDDDDNSTSRAFDVSGGLIGASPALFYAADDDDDGNGKYAIVITGAFDEMLMSEEQYQTDWDDDGFDGKAAAVVPLPASLLLGALGITSAGILKRYI